MDAATRGQLIDDAFNLARYVQYTDDIRIKIKHSRLNGITIYSGEIASGKYTANYVVFLYYKCMIAQFLALYNIRNTVFMVLSLNNTVLQN